MTPLAWQLRAVIEEGVLLALWESDEEFAAKAEMKPGTLTTHVNGWVSDESILRGTLAEANKVFQAERKRKPPKKIERKVQDLRSLYLEGIRRGRWVNIYQAADKIHVDGKSLTNYLKGMEVEGFPKRIKYAEELDAKLQRAVGKAHANPEEIPDHSDMQASITEDGIVVSPLFDRILRGEVAFEDQVTQDGTFVLKATNFRCLRGKLTPEQVLDTNACLELLADELTRRVEVINQIEETKHRIAVMRALSSAIDRLYAAIEEGLDVSESAAARNRKRLRDL